jgi:hypothetical protein
MSELIGDSSSVEELFNEDAWQATQIGYCLLLTSRISAADNPDLDATKAKFFCHTAGSKSADASTKEKLAYWISTHCPSNEYAKRASFDQLIRWLELRSDYIGISKCFLALNSEEDPLRKRLDDPDDRFDDWDYQQIWSYAKAFGIIYEVLTQRWMKFRRAALKLAQYDSELAFEIDNPWVLFITLIQETADLEIQKCFELLHEDRTFDYGRLVTLKRREIGKAGPSKGKKQQTCPETQQELAPAEKSELQKLLQHQIDKKLPLFTRVQAVWELLAREDTWLFEQLEFYKALWNDIWVQEQDATHKPELKEHRPSETWHRGRKRINKRGPRKK